MLRKTTYPINNDHLLVELFKNGDDNAFEILFKKYKRGLIVKFIKICKNRSLAEDLLQETCLKAIIAIKDGKYQNKNFPGWLYVIGFNYWMTQIKKDRRLPLGTTNDIQDYQLPYSASPEDLFVKEEGVMLFNKTVELLPKKEYAVLRPWLDGYHYKEIQEMLNIPIGTCRSRINRAKKTFINIG